MVFAPAHPLILTDFKKSCFPRIAGWGLNQAVLQSGIAATGTAAHVRSCCARALQKDGRSSPNYKQKQCDNNDALRRPLRYRKS
jgi:hypothetical protein